MSKDVLRLYQLKDTEENEKYLFQSSGKLYANHLTISVDRYDLIFQSNIFEDEGFSDVLRRLKLREEDGNYHHALSTSDVIALIRSKKPICYYLEDSGYTIIEGFITAENADSAPILTAATTNYPIPGKLGLWNVTSSITVQNKTFYLLHSKSYSDGRGHVLDGNGQIICENVSSDWDEQTIQRIHQHLNSPDSSRSVSRQSHEKPKMLLSQKYFENGEAVRSASSEVTEEQNYNMIDGTQNNQQKKPRESVRKRLKEKLELLGKQPEKRTMIREKS